MKEHIEQWIGIFVAFLLSAVGALFGVLNILFSDIFGVGQRIMSYVYVVLVYAAFGFVLTILWPKKHRVWMRWLGIPAVVIAVIYTFTESTMLLIGLGAASFALIGAWGGTSFARWIRSKKTSPSSSHTAHE